MQLTLETPPESWQQRFNALAEWRTLTSANENCDPSDLLTFPAMRHLAEHSPATIEALQSIEGVGSLATDRYADELSAILGIHATQPEPPTPEPLNRSEAVPSWQTTLDLYQAGHTILAIAERRMLSPGTISTHLVTALRHGHDVDLRPALPSTEMVQAVRRLLSEDPDASGSDLHERSGYRLSRAEIQIAIAYLRPPDRFGS
jgi:ATP-dependent DNA helicase RecQ